MDRSVIDHCFVINRLFGDGLFKRNTLYYLGILKLLFFEIIILELFGNVLK